MIVAIDTSSALTVLGTGTPAGPGTSVSAEGARRHAEAIDVLFADYVASQRAAIEAIAVGIGPAPYSGLRVGISFAVGLGRSLNVPVLGVCSLDARAWQVLDDLSMSEDQEFLVTSDARRGEVYWAGYRIGGDGSVVRTAGPAVGTADSLPEHLRVFADVDVDPARMACEVARLLDQGLVAIDPRPVLVPHGDGAENAELPAGPLFTPTPLYLRQPDVTLSGGVGG